jgi:hypothetical protein
VYGRYHQNSSIALDVIDRSGKTKTLGVVAGQTPDVIDPVLSWAPNGREVWFRSFDVNEWGTIYALDMAGHRRVVTRIPGHATVYDIARDGRLLLRTDTRQVGILGMGPGDTVERDLSCLDNAVLNGISEDGRVIVATIIGESGGPKGSVYLRKMDGSPPIRLGDGVAFALSPDGNWVSGYYAATPSMRQYVVLPTGAGEVRNLAIPGLHKSALIVYGWSRDDQTMFLHSASKDGGWRLQNFAWNPDSGAVRPIGPAGVGDGIPMLSPDRGQVLDPGPDGRWWVYPVAGGEGHAVQGVGAHDRVIGWREDNRSIYISTHHDVNQTIPISVLDIVSGQKTPWKELRASRPVDEAYLPRITPDGRAYAYNFRVKLSDLYIASGLR